MDHTCTTSSHKTNKSFSKRLFWLLDLSPFRSSLRSIGHGRQPNRVHGISDAAPGGTLHRRLPGQLCPHRVDSVDGLRTRLSRIQTEAKESLRWVDLLFISWCFRFHFAERRSEKPLQSFRPCTSNVWQQTSKVLRAHSLKKKKAEVFQLSNWLMHGWGEKVFHYFETIDVGTLARFPQFKHS